LEVKGPDRGCWSALRLTRGRSQGELLQTERGGKKKGGKPSKKSPYHGEKKGNCFKSGGGMLRKRKEGKGPKYFATGGDKGEDNTSGAKWCHNFILLGKNGALYKMT